MSTENRFFRTLDLNIKDTKTGFVYEANPDGTAQIQINTEGDGQMVTINAHDLLPYVPEMTRQTNENDEKEEEKDEEEDPHLENIKDLLGIAYLVIPFRELIERNDIHK